MNFGCANKWLSDALLVLALGSIAKLLPHPPNFSPLWVLTTWIAARWCWYQASLLIVATTLFSDAVWATIHHYAWLGQWSVWTYSALVLGIVLGGRLHAFTLWRAFAVTLFYWIWTNLGVWLTTSFYPSSLAGLSQCYIAAWPFLTNAVLGTVVWYGAFRLQKPEFGVAQPLGRMLSSRNMSSSAK